MPQPTPADIATAIAQGAILTNWWFWVLWLTVTAVGSAIGVWLSEKIKGDVSKEIWLAQESWKEKYRLYTLLIQASEEIAQALWNIHTDTRVLTQMGLSAPSTEADGIRLFPEHRKYLEIEERAHERLQSAEVGVTLMLNTHAREAYKLIKGANTTTTYAINLSYYQRIETRVDAAVKAKVAYI